jgi:hypothetical protein
VWTRERVPDPFTLIIKRLINEIDFAGTLWAAIDLTPNGVFDTSFCLAILVKRFVHPAEFLLNFVEQSLSFLGKRLDIERQVVICRDEGCCWRQVVEDDAPRSPLWRGFALLLPFGFQLMPIG